MMGLVYITSPEAFEEVFWKSQTNLESKNKLLKNNYNEKTIENFKIIYF